MMDEKMKDEMMAEWEKLGLTKDQIDDHVLWGGKKVMFGIAKVKWALKEKGVDDAKAKDMLKKMTTMVIDSDVKMDMDMKKDWHDHKHDCQEKNKTEE